MCVFSSSHFTWARPLISGVTASTKTRFAQHERCHCWGTPPPQIGTPIGHRHTSSSGRSDEKWRYASATLRQHRHEPSRWPSSTSLWRNSSSSHPLFFFASPPRFFLHKLFRPLPAPIALFRWLIRRPAPTSHHHPPAKAPFSFILARYFYLAKNYKISFLYWPLRHTKSHTHLSWGTLFSSFSGDDGSQLYGDRGSRSTRVRTRDQPTRVPSEI